MSITRAPTGLTLTRWNNSSNPFSRHKTRKHWFAKNHQKPKSKRGNAKKRNGTSVRLPLVAQTWDKADMIISLYVDDRHGYIVRLVSHHGKVIPCPYDTIDKLNGTSDRDSMAGRSPLRSCLQRAQGRELALARQGQCPEDGRQIRSRGALMTSETSVRFHRTAFIHSTHLIVSRLSGRTVHMYITPLYNKVSASNKCNGVGSSERCLLLYWHGVPYRQP